MIRAFQSKETGFMNLVDRIEHKEMKEEVPEIRIGDTVRVHIRIVEGAKERVQVVEGVVIKMRGSQNRKTITVRKISFGVGVERIFPLHSPRVEKVLRGKAARLKEIRIQTKKGTGQSKKKAKAAAKSAAKKAAAQSGEKTAPEAEAKTEE
jgi:large subunit ribosomal protein L19